MIGVPVPFFSFFNPHDLLSLNFCPVRPDFKSGDLPPLLPIIDRRQHWSPRIRFQGHPTLSLETPPRRTVEHDLGNTSHFYSDKDLHRFCFYYLFFWTLNLSYRWTSLTVKTLLFSNDTSTTVIVFRLSFLESTRGKMTECPKRNVRDKCFGLSSENRFLFISNTSVFKSYCPV